jgi:hypothetical protein
MVLPVDNAHLLVAARIWLLLPLLALLLLQATASSLRMLPFQRPVQQLV